MKNLCCHHQDAVKEPKKRGRESDKKDVAKSDEAPTKRGRGRPPKSGGGSVAKKEKPKVFVIIYVIQFLLINFLHIFNLLLGFLFLSQSKTGKRGRPKKSDKKEKEESAEDEDSKEDNEDEDDE